MTIDVTQQLNYSQAVRRARPEWDDDKVRKAAEYLILYMDVRLKPYKVNEKLEEISTSHEEYQNELECRDAADAHETFYPNLCDV